MPAGRPKKHVTKEQLKVAQKEYRSKFKNITVPKEIVEEFIELKDDFSYSGNYPFKLTNPQFFRVLIETYRNNQK